MDEEVDIMEADEADRIISAPGTQSTTQFTCLLVPIVTPEDEPFASTGARCNQSRAYSAGTDYAGENSSLADLQIIILFICTVSLGGCVLVCAIIA